jgi:predicted DNA-binding protein YlxM (UPF0122 family)
VYEVRMASIDKRERLNMLFDIYGGLMSAKQQAIFRLYHMEDCTLAEVSDEMGITPQGVKNTLDRMCAKMEKFEAHLGILQKENTNGV